MKHFDRRYFFFRTPLTAMLVRRRNECTEQRMRLQRLRFEFGMKLASDEMRMAGQLNHLYVGAIRRRSRNPHSRGHHRLFIFSIKFVTMPVPLADLTLA